MTKRCEVHKVKRIKLDRNKYPIYKCINCPSYYTEPLVIGQMVECWICGKPFPMTQKTLKLKPNCGCKNTVELVETNSGAAMDDTKNKVLKIRAKKINPEIESVKSDILNHLMSKLGQ